MPAESKDQKQAARLALKAKLGRMNFRNLKEPARRMARTMTLGELKDFALKEEE